MTNIMPEMITMNNVSSSLYSLSLKNHKRISPAKIPATINLLNQTRTTLLSEAEPKYLKLERNTASTISFKK